MSATETTTPNAVDETPDTTPDMSGNNALFDKQQYDDPELQVNPVDGQSIDKIKLSFTGSVMLDRGSKADVALYRRLALGKGDVTLMVEGRCSASGAKQSTNREGDLDVVIGEKTIKVDTVYISTADGVTHAISATADDEDGGQAFDEPAED